MPDWLKTGWNHVWLPYAQMQTEPLPAAAASTRGSKIFLADGTVLIDGIASWWTACHGYNHPHIAREVAAQLEAMPHVMFGGLAHEQAYRLATRLAGLMPPGLERVFFTDSGSVAVEVAIKIAVQSRLNKGERGRNKILAFTGGYHGDTLGTMAICDPEEGMHSLFTGLLPEHPVIALPRDEASIAAFDAFLQANAHHLAAIITEPLVQGAGGMILHEPEVLRRLRKAADRYGLSLIFDEIFTGFGRTGTMFACEHEAVVPDLLCVGKALAGGVPIGATIGRPAVMDAWPMSQGEALHTATFLGNPLACAAALATLDELDRLDLIARVRDRAGAFARRLERFRRYPQIVAVRGSGYLWALEFASAALANRVVVDALARGVILLQSGPTGSSITLAPPLVIEDDQLERALDLTESSLRSMTYEKSV
jgi:adenosylmethionine-8-amino-7-oxononanoate aminotransferase